MNQGRHSEAVRAARALHFRHETAGEAAYHDATQDGAFAQVMLGFALQKSGDAGAAMQHLEEASQRFVHLGDLHMASVALTKQADCLRDLGHYDEAVEIYEEAIRIAEKLSDLRQVAVGKTQLGVVRGLQKKY